MVNVVILFRNPYGAEHREVIQVNPEQNKKATEHPKVLMRVRELQKDLDCEILKVFVEKDK